MKRKLIALRCAAHRRGAKLEGVKMKKRMTITMLAIVVGVLAACIGTLVEKIDYVVCDGVLHIESSQFWGLQKSSWQCPIKDITNVRPRVRSAGGRRGGVIAILVGDSPSGEVRLGKYHVTKELERCWSPDYDGGRVEVSEFPHLTILPLLLLCIAVIAFREIKDILRLDR